MSAGTWALVAVGAAVLVGAGTQRVTGLGFSLVASPFLVLALGAFDGVLLVNLLGSVTAAVVLLQVRRDVDVRHALLLAAPAVVAVVPGAWIARRAEPAVLQVVVGACIVVALTAVLVADRRSRASPPPAAAPRASGGRRRAGVLAAGGASGLMNALAGVGGPAVTVYATLTRWPHRSFAATVQLYFTIVGVASLAAKGGLPSLPPVGWGTAVAALAAGIGVGTWLQPRVPPSVGRRAAVLLALVGGAATLGRGAVDLWR